ncbi:MAG TPA: polyphosphate kinase 1, partial [Chloroflexota bacterium]|nr:polyphosphate kinase 1 [Chloroflexota bacterium]
MLAEASNRRHPLLERVRFLAISDSNLDEFLMVRLAGVQAAVRSGCFEAGPDGRAPSQQLTEIRQAVRLFLLDQRRALHELLPLLMTEGMEIVDWDTVPVSKQARLRRWIADRLAPACRIVTLRARPRYPFVSGLTGNLAVALRYSRNRPRLAVLNVPPEAPRLLAIASSRPNRLQRYVWLEDALQAALPDIFPHAAVESACTFRLLRNADFEVHNINAHNLVEKVLLGISRREHGEPVALQVEAGIDCDLRDMLARNLQLDSKDVYPIDGPFGLAGLSQLAQAQQPRLQYSPPSGRLARDLRPTRDLFARLRQNDVLLHHPFDSFDPALRLVRQAAADPLASSIKLTLYRIDAPVVDALCEAARARKNVLVLLEIKARFDEKNNLAWASRLEEAGVRVSYGFAGLKVHCKALLIERQEVDGIRHYVQLGTGNFNCTTAQQYTDLSLLTCNPGIAAEVSHVFDFLLDGRPLDLSFSTLLVAPVTLRSGFQWRIEREIDAHFRTGKGHIVFKMNALVDPVIVAALCRASRAGVKVDLVVRGACCLRPGVQGFSNRIRVVSPIGRFLEHSRVFYFANGGQEEMLIGSADLMPRNL